MLLHIKFRYEDEDYKVWTVTGLVTPFFLARIKAMDAYTVLSLSVVRYLERSKRLKARYEEHENEAHGAPVHFSFKTNDETGSSWEYDPTCVVEDEVITKTLFEKFLETLTQKQLETLYHVLICQETRTEYAKSIGRHESTIREIIEAIRKKFEKFFE